MDEFDNGEVPSNEDDTTEVVIELESELPVPDTLPPDEIQGALEAPTVFFLLEGDTEEVPLVFEGGAATPEGVVSQWAPPEVHISSSRWDESAKSVTKMSKTDWASNEKGGGGITGVQGSSDA